MSSFLLTYIHLLILLSGVAIVLTENCSDEGVLRYIGSSESHILQICVRDLWRNFCATPNSYQWGINEAKVACYQMGMSWKQGSDLNISKMTSNRYSAYFQNISCSGIEKNLISCSVIATDHDDIHLYDCISNDHKYYYATAYCIQANLSCISGSISLENKSLRICAFGQWHTLCGNTWTLAQAKVACRQLGRNPIGAKNTLVSRSIHDFTPVLNAYFHCNGEEDNLKNCPVKQFSNCDLNSFKAGLDCGESCPQSMLIQSLDSSVQIQWNYNESNGTEYFYVYCKATYQRYQSSYCYSKTILYNGDGTFNTSITGLLPNTTYTCCVLAVTSYGESEPVCQTITTTNVTMSTVLIKSVTPVTICQFCTLNSTCIQTPLIVSSDILLSGSPWAAGGIIVGVVSGVLIMMTIWGLVAVIKKNRRNLRIKRNDERSHDEYQLNMGALDNPTYEQNIIQSTQSNSTYQDTDLPEDQYLISVNMKSKTMTSDSQVNDTSGGVPSFIYQDDVQMEGVYSLPDNQQTGEGLYNQLQRN